MSTDRKGRPAPAPVDPVELDRLITAYVDLELLDRGAFREALAENILDPDPAETAAFRSDELAAKSLAACQWLQSNTKEVLRNRSRNKDQQRRSMAFQKEVNNEALILDSIVTGIYARQGKIRTPRNPKKRAQQRLYDLNLKGDVPQGTGRAIYQEELDKDAAAIEAEEKERAAKRREAKARKERRRAGR